MYEEYPISGITQSYRHTSRSKTVVLPVLMTALVAAMAIFYVKGKPADPIEEETVIVSHPVVETFDESPKEIATEVNFEVTFPSPVEDESTTEEVIAPDVEPSEAELLKTAEVVTDPIKENDFTPWMEPLALDTYIRAKSSANGKSFWESGHWITSVEGRWKNSTQEFRIAYDKIPEIETWQWRYKVNQSQAEFATSVSDLVEQGYTLVHTQTFRDSFGDHRYQGVWHRQLARPTVADTTPASDIIQAPAAPNSKQADLPSQSAAAAPTSEPRGLNVNRLNFR